MSERTVSGLDTQQYEQLLRSSLDAYVAVLVVGIDDEILYSNARWRQIWGLPDGPPDAVDPEFLQLARNKIRDVDAFEARIAYLRANPEQESFELVQFVDGRLVERYTAPLYRDGTLVAQIWAFRDLSDRMDRSHLSATGTLVSRSGESARRLAAAAARVRAFVSEHTDKRSPICTALVSLLHDAIDLRSSAPDRPAAVLTRYRQLHTATGLGLDPGRIEVVGAGATATVAHSVDALLSAEIFTAGLAPQDSKRAVSVRLRDDAVQLVIDGRSSDSAQRLPEQVRIAQACVDLIAEHAACRRTVDDGTIVLQFLAAEEL